MKGAHAMSKKDEKAADAATDSGARSFAVFLTKFGEGTLHAELSEALRDTVKTLETHAADFGKAKGVLTLNLAIAIDREGGLVVIVPEVKSKLPKPLRKHGVFWIDKSQNLVAENPRQTTLPLAAVPQAAVRAAPVAEPGERSAPAT